MHTQITFAQLKSLRYGYQSIGGYTQIKLRFTAKLMRLIQADEHFAAWLPDLSIFYNSADTHAHIACIIPVTSQLMHHFNNAKLRAQAQLLRNEANAKLAEQLSTKDIFTMEWPDLGRL